MSRLGPEPRINSRLLSQFKGQTVRLTVKVVKLNGDTATVEASDGGPIGVVLPRDIHIEDPFVELIALVKDDLSVRALTNINLGKNIDMKAVDALVTLSNSSKGVGVLC
ncbi:hypothetical protein M231_03188 [Tremella mesenterica]|uniref:Replication factor A3 n=1 Tax=Tremella mesenterica TaxID=5217 RepID=A0A4Q1BNS7_TREME|nr:hypothetical protein M231_03188 [Tremella mesenterica]